MSNSNNKHAFLARAQPVDLVLAILLIFCGLQVAAEPTVQTAVSFLLVGAILYFAWANLVYGSGWTTPGSNNAWWWTAAGVLAGIAVVSTTAAGTDWDALSNVVVAGGGLTGVVVWRWLSLQKALFLKATYARFIAVGLLATILGAALLWLEKEFIAALVLLALGLAFVPVAAYRAQSDRIQRSDQYPIQRTAGLLWLVAGGVFVLASFDVLAKVAGSITLLVAGQMFLALTAIVMARALFQVALVDRVQSFFLQTWRWHLVGSVWLIGAFFLAISTPTLITNFQPTDTTAETIWIGGLLLIFMAGLISSVITANFDKPKRVISKALFYLFLIATLSAVLFFSQMLAPVVIITAGLIFMIVAFALEKNR